MTGLGEDSGSEMTVSPVRAMLGVNIFITLAWFSKGGKHDAYFVVWRVMGILVHGEYVDGYVHSR